MTPRWAGLSERGTRAVHAVKGRAAVAGATDECAATRALSRNVLRAGLRPKGRSSHLVANGWGGRTDLINGHSHQVRLGCTAESKAHLGQAEPIGKQQRVQRGTDRTTLP